MGTKYPRRDEERFVTSLSLSLSLFLSSAGLGISILILALVALMANLCAKRSSITGARE